MKDRDVAQSVAEWLDVRGKRPVPVSAIPIHGFYDWLSL
jgi:hypothetical protein